MTHKERNQRYIDAWRPGMSVSELAQDCGVTYNGAKLAAHRLGLQMAPYIPELLARNLDIAYRVGTGACTLQQIADDYEISRQRVQQIAARMGAVTPDSVHRVRAKNRSTPCPR